MTNEINGIDVNECPLFDKKTGCYHTFNGECVKDSCAVYKWLLEHKRLQEKNEKLKENQCCLGTCEYIATEIIRYSNICEINSKYKQALEEIRNIAEPIKENTCFGMYCGAVDWILNEINEVLNDRD